MKLYLIAILAGSSLSASDVPPALTFADPSLLTSSFKLSEMTRREVAPLYSGAPAAASHADRASFPLSATDLVAPVAPRLSITQAHQANIPEKAGVAAPVKGQEISYYPTSPTDLIGRTSDQKKIIQELNFLLEAKKVSNQSPEPAPNGVAHR
jgi:hypothetical protein